MPHIYVAPWEWQYEDGQFLWNSPVEDAIGSYDLRTHSQSARKGGTPLGVGVFVYETRRSIPNSVYLGDDPLRALTLAESRMLEDALGFSRGLLPGGSLANALATSIKGTESDAAGLRAVVPLRSSKRKGAVITLGGFGEVWWEPFSTNQQAFLDTLEIRKNDYRRNALAGMPLALLERWTGYDMLKFFGELDHKHLDKLIPGGEFPTHSFRAPATTFVDTFVDTNGTNLEDHTPTGSPAASGWTEIVGGAGSIDIVTGDIAQTTALDVDIQYMIDDNLASDDHYAEAVIDATETGSGGAIGTTVRKASGATETFNGLQFRTTAARIRLFRVNGGSPTALITDNSPTMTNGSLARVEIDGNDLLSCYDDGVLDASVTDGSPLTGNFLTGLWGSKGTTGAVNWDNFKASDLAAGGFAHSQAVIVG